MLDLNHVILKGAFASQPRENRTLTQTVLTHAFLKGMQDGRPFYIETTSVDMTARLVYRFARPQRLYVVTGTLDSRLDLDPKRTRVRLTTLHETERGPGEWVAHGQYEYPDGAQAYAMLSGTAQHDSTPSGSPAHPWRTVIESVLTTGRHPFQILTAAPLGQGQHVTTHGTLRTHQHDVWLECQFAVPAFNPFADGAPPALGGTSLR
ncbi:hypothetical protein [Deinococcus petrolearius]|uniref:Uncharacterized protein n=1 Tax=Deinococcus petrolearius TaxID=1751295 RepID=A0ABW1DNQ0_9DEIO